MTNLDQLQRLTREMYLHTRNAPRTAQHAASCQSLGVVRRAPISKLAPAEQEARLQQVQRCIIQDLLKGQA